METVDCRHRGCAGDCCPRLLSASAGAGACQRHIRGNNKLQRKKDARFQGDAPSSPVAPDFGSIITDTDDDAFAQVRLHGEP